jgi:hypothetical protein
MKRSARSPKRDGAARGGGVRGTAIAKLAHSFFTDVIEKDPRFDSTARIDDLALLEPTTRSKVQAIVAEAHAQGMELMIFETYRSQQRQQMLFEQGSTKLRVVGVHHFGLACDLVKDVSGEPSWKGDFSLLGHLALKYRLIWGGDWGNPDIHHTFVDNVHVQRCSIARQASLFRGEWYPDDEYDPYDDLKVA